MLTLRMGIGCDISGLCEPKLGEATRSRGEWLQLTFPRLLLFISKEINFGGNETSGEQCPFYNTSTLRVFRLKFPADDISRHSVPLRYLLFQPTSDKNLSSRSDAKAPHVHDRHIAYGIRMFDVPPFSPSPATVIESCDPVQLASRKGTMQAP